MDLSSAIGPYMLEMVSIIFANPVISSMGISLSIVPFMDLMDLPLLVLDFICFMSLPLFVDPGMAWGVFTSGRG